jgi:hypothetical protein
MNKSKRGLCCKLLSYDAMLTEGSKSLGADFKIKLHVGHMSSGRKPQYEMWQP